MWLAHIEKLSRDSETLSSSPKQKKLYNALWSLHYNTLMIATAYRISVESYSQLTGLESQVKTYEDQAKTLEDHDNMVKRHANVAEEAVSGDAYLGTLRWEKAEAEALTLKNHLESVTLLKLMAEVRASHLDGALKECMSAEMEFERTQTKIA
ncbi:hypothetical protein C3L33_13313, partial [Rhododendron williamsianum]